MILGVSIVWFCFSSLTLNICFLISPFVSRGTHVCLQRCTPLSLVVAERAPSPYVLEGIPPPVTSKDLLCPVCLTGRAVTGIRLFPMNFSDLERAVELRKVAAKASAKQKSPDGSDRKRGRDDDLDDDVYAKIQAEAAYLLHTSHSGRNDSHHHRTGRWSNEEIKFVDALVQLFEQASLPVPHGLKLNDFLGDMLICKSSRLTKKMKNAKLSTRSYVLKSPPPGSSSAELASLGLSNLQESFLASVASEATQLELRFNMTKLWRTHFSNVCLQVGYEMLDARDWVASLEEMEHRASEAENSIRKARRRRMSQALRNDVGAHVNDGVFVAGMPARDATMQPPLPPMAATSMPTESSLDPGVRTQMKRGPSEVTMSGPEEEEDDEFLAALEMTVGDTSGRSRLFSEDYTLALEALADPSSLSLFPGAKENPAPALGDCGSFLEEVVHFMEARNIPFQHVDVWVPSYVNEKNANTAAGPSNETGTGTLRLFHAGHATRSDLNPTTSSQLNEYGVYSTHFSFAPGVGLPGRVYSSGQPTWEKGIHTANVKLFERAGGANVYGVKSALGIPVEAPGIGRIVVAMYGTEELDEDPAVKEMCMREIAKWTPEPKWKLVIDLGNSEQGNNEVMAAPTSMPAPSSTLPPTQLMHFSHKKLPCTSDQATNFSPAAQPEIRETQTTKIEMAHYSYTKAPEPSMPTALPQLDLPPSSAVPAATLSNAMYPPEPSTVGAPLSPQADADEDAEEQTIATLLGDHMPADNAALIPHFMSLRLLLLRSSSRRSKEEIDLLDVVKRSFRGYSKDNKRNGAELAVLLAKDWSYLNPTSSMAMSPKTQHQSHVMAAATSTMSSSGAPTKMPSPLLQLPPPPMNPTGLSFSLEQVQAAAATTNNSTMAFVTPRSRSVSASSDSPLHHLADIVPET